jgi:phosphatidylglycerophosphate synthase
MLCAIGAAVALLWTSHAAGNGESALYLAAAGLIPLRLLANMLDGMVAVEGGRRSALGEVYNEVPDRVSDVAVLVGAGYSAGSVPELGWMAAVLAVFVAYIRALGKGMGLASDYCGPMAKQERMLVVVLVCLYLGLAPAGWRPVSTFSLPFTDTTVSMGVMGGGLALIAAGCVITAVRRLVRMARRLRARGV